MKRGTPISASLSSPTAVAVDAAENVYVTESVKNRLLVYGPGGEYLRKLDGLARPAGVAVDDRGTIYVCSMGRKSVEVYDAELRRLRALGSGSGEFELPVGIATGTVGRLYVADARANVVKVYHSNGTFAFAFGGPGNGDGLFNFPTSVASDPGSGDIAVSDLRVSPAGVKGARVQLFDADGRFKRVIAGYGQGEGLLMKPLGTAIDGGGRIYVSDANQNIVHVYDGDGRYQATVYDRDRPLRTPLGIAVSRRTGRLYVASLNTSTVETYGDGTGTDGGNQPGRQSLSFSTSSGGACSMVNAPTRAPPGGLLVSLFFPVLWLLGRRLAGRRKRSWVRRRAMKGALLPFLLFAWAASAPPAASAGAFDYPWRPGLDPLYSVSPYGSMFEYPHSAVYDIGCDSCHLVSNPGVTPEWATFVSQNIDDTLFNSLCWQCHNDIVAPYVKTHSSLSNDNGYGVWSMECRICHQVHGQEQKDRYRTATYLFQGFVTLLSDNAITCAGAGWADNQYQGMVVYPDAAAWPYYSYKILRNSGDTLYVDGPMPPGKAGPSSPFAVIRGRAVRAAVGTPSSGTKTVRNFRDLGPNSASDGDGVYDGICEVCHTATVHYRNGASSDHSHRQGLRCTQCHRHTMGFKFGGGGAHASHDNVVSCDAGNLGCHGANEPPLMGDNQSLAGTAKCNRCHSAAGAAAAKSYWGPYGTPGSWAASVGEVAFCGSCHNSSPGYSGMDSGGDAAPNIVGNGSTYGYGVTGHGRTAGNYPRLSWQSASATGNPAAARVCSACHNLAAPHFNNPGKRLKPGFENDNANTGCRQCHDPGTAAVGAPPWYTTYAAFQASAHGGTKCTACHNVHGSAGANNGMTIAAGQALCLQAGCHAGMSGHAAGVAFGRGGQSYTLACVTCHNIHIVTGRISAADPTRTPLSRIDNNILLWGGAAGQKMSDYAGSGTYRTPKGDSLTGAQLPDYPTFCLQCHGQDMTPSIHGNISWSDPHGRGSANVPNGGGTCPDWYVCGLGKGWDTDNCIGGDNVCWPVMPRSFGDQLFSRDDYSHNQRIAGANFVLSCNDCHTTHVVSFGAWKTRGAINGSGITGEWKTICNACHYYYSDWHAGMSCGNTNSCHDANPNSRFGVPSESIHGMSSMSGDGSTRTFDNTLVVDMRFENNLNDSGGWRMHGRWPVTAGAFAAGRVGNAIQVSDQPVEVGTRNSYWSTDEGNHGTWKFTEMKYNMTLEAWVYPTDINGNERRVLAKSWYDWGGYVLELRKVNGEWRAALLTKTNGVRNDYRGAYSTTSVPVNEWSHIAATFDRAGPDGNPGDRSVGRIRIYVNGEDVTTSDASGSYVQPGAGETAMFPYSNHVAAPVGICFNDSWCASPLSIGGVNWSDNGANFIGRIDEIKVWNVTKNAAYFDAVDAQTPPRISRAEGVIGTNTLNVTFTEGVFANTGGTGALQPSDFVLTDADNGRTIAGVTHTAGASTAQLTLSAPLDPLNDVGTDTLAAAANSIFDDHNNAAGTTPVAISASSACPTGQVVFNLNEAAGSAYVLDTQLLLYGVVNDPSNTMGGGAFFGDNVNNYIAFQNNTSCMKASTALTLEARIRPTSMAGTGNYITRIFAKDTSANYQMSVWRNNATFAPRFNAPSGTASIAFWVAVDNTHGGNAWKLALTRYDVCPIVSDHWYVVRTVWDSGKPGGIPGQKFVPADIYVEDQGTNGNYNDNAWAGSVNCTDAAQFYASDNAALFTGDTIKAADSIFAIGSAAGTLGNNKFAGSIDWVTWDASGGAPMGAPMLMDLDLFYILPSP